jgi:hypothetical protein
MEGFVRVAAAHPPGDLFGGDLLGDGTFFSKPNDERQIKRMWIGSFLLRIHAKLCVPM